jgi:hypothetical protein
MRFTLALAGLTFVIAICAAYAPFLINPDLHLSGSEQYYPYTSYISGVATSLALIWIILNAAMQRRQLSIQQDELRLQRDILSRTASATFSQFYIMYFDEFELALDRISIQIMELIDLDTIEADRRRIKGERDAHIRALSKTENLVPLLKTRIKSDAGQFLAGSLQQYLYIYEQLSEMAARSSDAAEGTDILTLFEVANPSSQLHKTFAHILQSSTDVDANLKIDLPSGLYEEASP